MIVRWAYLKAQYHLVGRFLDAAKRAREVQHEVLFRKLRQAADSDFGHDHGLRSIQTIDDFRRHLPIADFEYYRPYVERVKAGDHGALFAPGTKVLMFATTSGTTDKPKYVPVTDQFFREYKRGWRIWGLQTHADHGHLLKKKYVHLASDWRQSKTSGGIWCGNISGLVTETRPWVIRSEFLVAPEVSRIPDWRSRQYVSLCFALASQRVGMVITANPLTLVSLAQLADAEKVALIRDLANGTLSHHVQVPDAVRTQLEGRLRRRRRERSRELEHIVERTGTLYPRDFWPGLSVVAVWTGGPAGTFLSQVQRYYGNTAFRDHGLSASEGRMTIPLRDGSSAGVLDVMSNYYEFIPVEEYGTSRPTVLEAHELQEGKSYYILLTTSSHFFRYDIHDVVRCIGFEANTPVLEFLHKGAHCSNVTGEKLTEYQVATAVRRAFADLHRPVDTLMLAPVLGERPGYVLLIEWPSDGIGVQLAGRIDAHLCDLNCEYANRLQTNRLRPLVTQPIPPGSWEAFRDRRISQNGACLEQYKHAFLTCHSEVINELVSPPYREVPQST